MHANKTKKSVVKNLESHHYYSIQSNVKLGYNLTRVTWVNLG